MQLDAYLKANPAKRAKLRKLLGRKTLHKYETGNVSRADPDTIEIITKATNYEVTANDFYGVDPLKAAKATMGAAA